MLICHPSRSAVLATSVMAWVRCSSKTPGGSSRRRQVVEEAEQDGFAAVGVQAAAARVELRAVGFRGVGGDAVHGVELADAVQQYVVSSGLLGGAVGGGVGAVQTQHVQAVCDRSSGVDEGCGLRGVVCGAVEQAGAGGFAQPVADPADGGGRPVLFPTDPVACDSYRASAQCAKARWLSPTRAADLAFCGGEARRLSPDQQAVCHHQRREQRDCHRPGAVSDLVGCRSRAWSHRLELAAVEVASVRREWGCRN